MARLIERLRQCIIRAVNRPFGFVVAVNDYANLILGLCLIFPITAIVDNSLIYQYLLADTNLWIWPGLIVLGSILSRIGFWTKNARMVSVATMISAISWMFALFLYVQFGTIAAGVPFIIRPVAIAVFTKLKIALDKDWHSK